MRVSAETQKRLLYAKYLLSRARSAQAERSELGVSVSLLLMHDAVEMFMLSVAEHLGLAKPKNWADFWVVVKPVPPQRIRMESLNKMRVSLKHYGILSQTEQVRDLMPKAESFCEDITKTYLDLDLAELSLADLVSDEDVRNTLGQAEKEFGEGKTSEAFTNLRRAFDQLYREVSNEVPRIRRPKGVIGVQSLERSVEECVQTLNVLMLGIDPVKYRFFTRSTPNISRTSSGVEQVCLAGDYTMSNAIFKACFDFVVDASLKIGQVFQASAFQTPTIPS